MEGIKKYYNSKLIEQLADNIKTKFIWFLWRKQVVRLVWVEEMKWNPLKQRRPPIQFLFFFPFSLFENERDEEKKRIDGQLAAEGGEIVGRIGWIYWWVKGGTAALLRKKEKTKRANQMEGVWWRSQ